MIDAFYQKQIDSMKLKTNEFDGIDTNTPAETFSNSLTMGYLVPWDELTRKYENFHCVGKLQAGEVATLACYSLDYGSFFYVSEDALTGDQRPTYSGTDYKAALQVLIDWWDAENAADRDFVFVPSIIPGKVA